MLESDLPVVVDAYATWCGPCKMVAPIFAELNESIQGKIKFVKFNVETDQELSEELNIEAMPTFIFFKYGKVVERHVGAMDKEGFLMHFVNLLSSKDEPQEL